MTSNRGPPSHEVVDGVVDYGVGAQGPHHLDIAGAADSGDVCAERFGDLHGEGSDAASRSVDQHVFAGLDGTVGTKTLESGEAADGRGPCSFERHVGGLGDDVGRFDGDVRSAATALALAEDGVARSEGGDVGQSLAERVGFKVMALYNHVANKDELLALMVDAVAGGIVLPSSGEPAMQAVRAHAIDTREAFVRHPWAPALWQQYFPGPSRIDHMESLLRLLNGSGLPADIAHHGFHAVSNHVLGYTLQELAMDFDIAAPNAHAVAESFLATMSSETHPHTVAHVREHLAGDTGSSFELVLDLILDGLVRLQADH